MIFIHCMYSLFSVRTVLF